MAGNDQDSTAIGDARPARRVLVVEDEVMILMMVEDVLAKSGFEPVTAASLNEGLALLEARDFDAALLDMHLNGLSVTPLADALAAREVPFAFATGGSDPDTLKGYGDRPVLTKPYRNRELVDVVAALTDGRAAAHGLRGLPGHDPLPRRQAIPPQPVEGVAAI